MSCTYFNYDCVISLDSKDSTNVFLRQSEESLKNKKVLGITYNHRAYNLNDKNYIKALIERFDMEHLFFSIKPSTIKLIVKCDEIDIDQVKAYTQVIFAMQCMVRYDIDVAYVSNEFLDTGTNLSSDAEPIYNKLMAWVDGISVSLQKTSNLPMKKVLASLHSLKSKRHKLEGKKLIFQEIAASNKAAENIFDDLDMNQISPLEKDLFWVGFDPTYKEVPWDKPYLETKFTEAVKSVPKNAGFYSSKLHYCNRCVMPETLEGITFDELGICNVCRSSEEKMHINWEEREENLNTILNNHRQPDYYDCMLPMSGGKDSTFQAYVLSKRYKVDCLAVTHGQNMYSLTGRYNLENCLQQFDMDHIIYNPKRSTISKAARRSLVEIGDACWHCHIGAGTFPIQTSLKWDLKMMIWGESIAENDGRGTYYSQKEASPFYNLEVSARVSGENMVDEGFSEQELNQWFYPSKEELIESQMRYLHLGDYMFWDEERQVEFVVRNFEWMDSQVENTYKGYKSTECVIAGVHDYLNFLKRGIGRATWHASDDVRRGLITREEGFELAKKHDTQRPHALDYYLKISGYTEEEIESEIIKARNLSDFAKKLNS